VFDENLIYQSQVLIKGIRECLSGPVSIYCLVSNSVEDRTRLEILNFSKIHDVEVVIVNEFSLWDDFTSQARSYIAYQKFLWELFLPDSVEYLVYLDIDIVPVANFDELFDLKFDAAFAAVALDDFISKRFERWKQVPNGGVNVFNTKKWKQENLTAVTIQYIKTFPRLSEMYADLVLGQICGQKWYRLNTKFNSSYVKTFYPSFIYKKKAILLVHFIGPRKPWNTHLFTPFNYFIIKMYRLRQNFVTGTLKR